jgi:hypothetical protein
MVIPDDYRYTFVLIQLLEKSISFIDNINNDNISFSSYFLF